MFETFHAYRKHVIQTLTAHTWVLLYNTSCDITHKNTHVLAIILASELQVSLQAQLYCTCNSLYTCKSLNCSLLSLALNLVWQAKISHHMLYHKMYVNFTFKLEMCLNTKGLLIPICRLILSFIAPIYVW